MSTDLHVPYRSYEPRAAVMSAADPFTVASRWSTIWARIFDLMADSHSPVDIATWLNARNRNLLIPTDDGPVPGRPCLMIHEGHAGAVLTEARRISAFRKPLVSA